MTYADRMVRLVAITTLLLLAACGGQPAATTSTDTSTTAASTPATSPTIDPASNNNPPTSESASPVVETPFIAPVSASGEQLVARVNSVDISQSALDRAVARYQIQQLAAADIDAMRATVLDTLIEQTLIQQEAARQNIVVTDADVQAEIDVNIQIAGSNESYQQWLTANLYTAEEFRETVRATLISNRLRDAVTSSLSGNVMQVHARHILVSTEADANTILSRLQAGEDFAALAAAYSNDVTTKQQGGDLGWFAQDELLEPYLAQMAFSLEPGITAGPVPTSLGFHVLQVIERAERPVPDDKRAMLAQNQFELWLESVRNAATIERF